MLEKPNVGEVEDTILCSGAVFPIVLAEILELVQSAQAQSLSEEQEKPVDMTLTAVDNRLHAICLVAHGAVQQARHHPYLWRPVVHRTLVGQEVSADLQEMRLQSKHIHTQQGMHACTGQRPAAQKKKD